MAFDANPYASPTTAYDRQGSRRESAVGNVQPALLALAPIGAAVGAAMGFFVTGTCTIVSFEYFELATGWLPRVLGMVWQITIRQGAFGGAVCGLLLGLLLTIVIAARSAMRCSFRRGMKWLLGVASAALVLWVAGGCCGAVWASISPQSYRDAFPIAAGASNVVRFAWVGGSIWGALFGSAAAAIVACIRFCRVWTEPTA